MSNKTFIVAKKELWTYFSSPTAFIFLGTYLLASLFTFFWVEKFFSRNIADLRPLFEWMPILLIFLCSTVTMKMWSEEKKMGTVEFLLTLPLKMHEVVLGKFLACLAMIGISLCLTLGLAVSVSILGPLDWGPVIGAYFGSLLLASAYISIGLFVSSKTENQIVSLIVTALICSLFYVLGSDTLSNFFGNDGSETLKFLGSGSHFSSISHGILDLRDIYYYVSISAVFLVANTFALEKSKWSLEAKKPRYTQMNAIVALLVVNLICANVWLFKMNSLRTDLTKGKIFSISEATKEVIDHLQEPLLIRGVFSARTHPLLSPLVPTIKDLLSEYKNASKNKINVEFLDPRTDEKIEAELNRKYGVEPVPFQIADRHSASMINSYFNIIIQYGDKHEVLGFADLIDVKSDGFSKIDVQLRNLEYDITRSIKKAMQGFNTTDNLFSSLDRKIKLVGYVSEESLPKQLKTFHGDIKKTLDDYKKTSGGKLEYEFLDPSKDVELAKTIQEKYGFSPQMMSLFAQSTFYYYLTIQDGDKVYGIGLPEDMSVANFKQNIDTTVKRLAPGFLRTVGIVTPPAPEMNAMMAQFGQQPQGRQFRLIEKKLEENYNTEKVDLKNGAVPSNVDVLLVIAPKDLDEKQVFAIDQFLMKGGTILFATSPVVVNKEQRGFTSEPNKSGLEEWLAHYGLNVEKALVLDEKNSGFPSIRKRTVQGITIKEPYLAPYPFFVDIRSEGLNQENPITSGLGQLNVTWASPIEIDQKKNEGRKIINLLKSSRESWTTSDIVNIEPNRTAYPEIGFAEEEKKEPSIVGVMVEGKFDSYFAGKESPLIEKANAPKATPENPAAPKEKKEVLTGVIAKSPNIARIFLISSNEFLADDTLQITGMLQGTQYINSLQIVENTLDWSTQDKTLLSIRSRGQFARTLNPLTDTAKRNWELINYFIAVLGLLSVFAVYKINQRKSLRTDDEFNVA